ncbi:hypothetical protein GCM10027057_07630 [Marisediminicola antarctica]
MADDGPTIRVAYSFPHPLGRPGIAETALQQILGLERLGVSLTLFCTSLGGVDLPESVVVHETMVFAGRRVPHRAIGVQRAYDFHDARVAHWLRANHERVDIVHAWPRGCLRTLQEAALLHKPAVRESPNPHTASVMRASAAAESHAGVSLPRNHSHAHDERVLKKEIAEYDAATAVLVPSDYARREFIAEGFDPSRLLQHRYGCDLGRFPARREPPRVGEKHPFRAVFVGRGDPTKGLHVALDAWRRAAIDDGELLVAGTILPGYRRALVAGLESPGVRELGFVTDIARVLAESDVLILPSWTEGSALVTLEAQASGCVPLVSEASGPIGVAGIDHLEQRVGDVDELAAQLAELAVDPQRLGEMSARGTQQRDFLSWDRAAEALVGCYRRAIALSQERRGATR